MSATLRLTHKAIGAEVRRGTYDVVFDGERVGCKHSAPLVACRCLGSWDMRSA